MRVLYYDCFAGISGDMNLGALLHLGVDAERLRADLAKLPLPEPYEFNIRTGEKHGITGLRIEVREQGGQNQEELGYHSHEHYHIYENNDEQSHEHSHEHTHEHNHSHDHTHEHNHSHDHTHEHNDTHERSDKLKHRHLAEMTQIISASSVPPRVKTRSLQAFNLLAEAEARVHGKTPEEVTFHELSGLDTIIDIVGGFLCLEYLDVDEVWSSPVELGGGFVRCAHGLLPVPAPAVAYLLQDVPVTYGRVPRETTTPTGAVLLKVMVDRFTDTPAFRLLGTGYGLGNRDLDIPNALRVMLGETAQATSNAVGGAGHPIPYSYECEQQYMLETNIDDMSAEILAYAEETLLQAGALDVYHTSIQMKKGRQGVKLSVLSASATVPVLRDLILRETSAIGLRMYPVEKIMLPRETLTLETPHGSVRRKVCHLPDGSTKEKWEYEDVKILAQTLGLSLPDTYQRLEKLRD